MKNILKQFEAWVISFKTDPFQKARLKLSIYYTLGLLFVLIIFNIATYGLFLFGLEELEDETLKDQQEIYKDRIENSLFISGTIFSIAIAALSYKFAQKSLEPAESAYIKQKQFVADCAHEMRTPLSVMKAGIENSLGKKQDIDGYQIVLEETMEEVNSLTTLVNDMLFLASTENKNKKPLETFDLVKFLEKEIEYFNNSIAEKKLDLYYSIPEQPLFIQANKAQLKRLIANLLTNAINYNIPDGSINIILKKENSIELSISDTGIGISKADMKHIFDRFYKADKARTHNNTGAGLGLAIVKEIVMNHGWKIKLSSELNKGTKVSIFI